MTIHNGRQWGARLDEIRGDHVARYQFAKGFLTAERATKGTPRVLDGASGIGYGSAIMAQTGAAVLAVDADEEAIDFGKSHWSAQGVEFRRADLAEIDQPFDVVVSFETIEHVEDAPALVRHFATLAPWLIASVPNEDVIPFDETRHPEHKRHYRPIEFLRLFEDAGYQVRERWSQIDKSVKRLQPGTEGRTLIYVAKRVTEQSDADNR